MTMTLHNSRPDRKRAFKAAIAHADKTIGEFCADQGVTRTHLHYVLTGERDSVKLNAAIDLFIAEHMPKVA